MKTLIGLTLGTLLSIGVVTSASAEGTSVAAPALLPAAGIEVIVVTAKRPAGQSASASEPIEEIVVTAKRPTINAERTPPAMPIVMPKLELAVAEQPVFRL